MLALIIHLKEYCKLYQTKLVPHRFVKQIQIYGNDQYSTLIRDGVGATMSMSMPDASLVQQIDPKSSRCVTLTMEIVPCWRDGGRRAEE